MADLDVRHITITSVLVEKVRVEGAVALKLKMSRYLLGQDILRLLAQAELVALAARILVRVVATVEALPCLALPLMVAKEVSSEAMAAMLRLTEAVAAVAVTPMPSVEEDMAAPMAVVAAATRVTAVMVGSMEAAVDLELMVLGVLGVLMAVMVGLVLHQEVLVLRILLILHLSYLTNFSRMCLNRKL